MILYHIWLGSEIPAQYIGSIRESHKVLGPNDRHVLYSDMTADCCEHVSEEELRMLVYKNNVAARVFEDFRLSKTMGLFKSYEKEKLESDIYRFALSLFLGDCMYADCDCVVKSVPQCPGDGIMAPVHEILPGMFDIYCLRFNRAGDKIMEMFNGLRNGPPSHHPQTIVNSMGVLRCGSLDPSCYVHPVKE